MPPMTPAELVASLMKRSGKRLVKPYCGAEKGASGAKHYRGSGTG